METETAPIKLTTSAISRVRALMDRSDKPVSGLCCWRDKHRLFRPHVPG